MLQHHKQMFYLARQTASVESDNGMQSSLDNPLMFCLKQLKTYKKLKVYQKWRPAEVM